MVFLGIIVWAIIISLFIRYIIDNKRKNQPMVDLVASIDSALSGKDSISQEDKDWIVYDTVIEFYKRQKDPIVRQSIKRGFASTQICGRISSLNIQHELLIAIINDDFKEIGSSVRASAAKVKGININKDGPQTKIDLAEK